MQISDFSNEFDTLVSSYRRFKDFDKLEILDSIEFDEYEKSVYLTMAQDELVTNLYNGKNAYGDSFESTEEMRRYLDVLVRSKEYSYDDKAEGVGLSPKSVFFKLPDDIAFIVLEQVTFGDETLGCANGGIAAVYPATHDEYAKLRHNPFRGASKHRVLRIDAGEGKVELISNFTFNKYLIRYISAPKPIILEDLPEGVSVNGESNQQNCVLNSFLHPVILKRAVQLALASKGINIKN